MKTICEVATVTSKGQITLPRSIRQALGVDFGDKVTFSLHGNKVIVTRNEDAEHRDPAILCFLSFLEKDIESGSTVHPLPAPLAQAMSASLAHNVDDEIQGHVEL